MRRNYKLIYKFNCFTRQLIRFKRGKGRPRSETRPKALEHQRIFVSSFFIRLTYEINLNELISYNPLFLNPSNLKLNNSLKNNIYNENILMEEDFAEAFNLILVSYDNFTEGFAEHFEFKNLQTYLNYSLENAYYKDYHIISFINLLDSYVFKFLDYWLFNYYTTFTFLLDNVDPSIDSFIPTFLDFYKFLVKNNLLILDIVSYRDNGGYFWINFFIAPNYNNYDLNISMPIHKIL